MKETQTNEVTLTKESHVKQIIDHVKQHKNDLQQLFDKYVEEKAFEKLGEEFGQIVIAERVLENVDYDDFAERNELSHANRMFIIGIIIGMLFHN